MSGGSNVRIAEYELMKIIMKLRRGASGMPILREDPNEDPSDLPRGRGVGSPPRHSPAHAIRAMGRR